MFKSRCVYFFPVILSCFAFSSAYRTATAEEILTGDSRLACEVILCLSSAVQPVACSPSLTRYFGITADDVFDARWNFLNLCPAVSSIPELQGLASAIVNGAGRCDATSLNASRLSVGYTEDNLAPISDVMPAYCMAYINHPMTDLADVKPVYVGIPQRGGYWVTPDQYESALTAYNERIAREDLEAQQGQY